MPLGCFIFEFNFCNGFLIRSGVENIALQHYPKFKGKTKFRISPAGQKWVIFGHFSTKKWPKSIKNQIFVSPIYKDDKHMFYLYFDQVSSNSGHFKITRQPKNCQVNMTMRACCGKGAAAP